MIHELVGRIAFFMVGSVGLNLWHLLPLDLHEDRNKPDSAVLVTYYGFFVLIAIAVLANGDSTASSLSFATGLVLPFCYFFSCLFVWPLYVLARRDNLQSLGTRRFVETSASRSAKLLGFALSVFLIRIAVR